METLAPLWMGDAADPNNPPDQGPAAAWESAYISDRMASSGEMGAEISAHLQKNKQLQEALLQREAELLCLQEENNKLRRFLGSASIQCLELKVRRQTPGYWKSLKRKQRHHQAATSKLTHRNRKAEFCQRDPGTSELGLDTINTSDHTPSVNYDPSVCMATESIMDNSIHDLGPPLSSLGEVGWSSCALRTQLTGDMTPLALPTNCSSQESLVLAQAGFVPLSPTSSSATLSDQQLVPPPRRCVQAGVAYPAFSTSLSPSSSVRTQSFPQGQVFLRRDPEGHWSFTWIPNRTITHNHGATAVPAFSPAQP